jgi:hypothetical protein
MDFPGFGLSEGLHGYIPSFDDLVDDAIEFYTKIKGMVWYGTAFKISILDVTLISVAIYVIISTFVNIDL